MPHTFGFDSVGGGGGSGGITDLNGLIVSTQSFAVGTAGVDFGIVSVSPTHTFNLPDASAVSRGALTSADWSTFNGKLSTAILSINGMTGTAQTINSGSTGTDLNIASAGDITTINIPSASTTARGLVTTGTQTFGGAKTIQNNAPNNLVLTSTYTTTGNGQSQLSGTGTITMRNTAGESYGFVSITPSLVCTANSQVVSALVVNPTYTGFGSGTTVARRYSVIIDGMGISGANGNLLFGQNAGRYLFGGGFNNTAIGNNALAQNGTGFYSVAIGDFSLFGSASNQALNVGIGYSAGISLTNGNSNVIIGGVTLQHSTNTSDSVIVGRLGGNSVASTGANNTSGSSQVLLGAYTQPFAIGDTNEIVIGTSSSGQGSNTVVLGNNSITRTFLKGDTAIGYQPTTATITPSGRLDVLGASAVTGTALIVSNSTPTQLFRIDNNGNIGFYTATPVARATTGGASSTYSAVGGTNVQTNDTFDGYTVAQVVKALRDIGILT